MLQELMDDEDEMRDMNLSSRPGREDKRRVRERDRLEREMERSDLQFLSASTRTARGSCDNALPISRPVTLHASLLYRSCAMYSTLTTDSVYSIQQAAWHAYVPLNLSVWLTVTMHCLIFGSGPNIVCAGSVT